MMFVKDHAPAHIHGYVGDGMVKIRLKDASVLEATNVKESELKKVVRITQTNRDKLYRAWMKLHGEDTGWA